MNGPAVCPHFANLATRALNAATPYRPAAPTPLLPQSPRPVCSMVCVGRLKHTRIPRPANSATLLCEMIVLTPLVEVLCPMR